MEEKKTKNDWDQLVEVMKSTNLQYKIRIWEELKLKGPSYPAWSNVYGSKPTKEQKAQMFAISYWSIEKVDVRDALIRTTLEGKSLQDQEMYLMKISEICPPGCGIRFQLMRNSYKDYSMFNVAEGGATTPDVAYGYSQTNPSNIHLHIKGGNDCDVSVSKSPEADYFAVIACRVRKDATHSHLTKPETQELVHFLIKLLSQ